MHSYTLILDKWFIATDENNCGKEIGWSSKIPESAITATVPSIIQQYFPEYHGVAFYWCRFTPPQKQSPTDRLILKFGGVDYKAEIWVDGAYIGEYESGEAEFSFDITDNCSDGVESLLCVRVVNPSDKPIDGLVMMNIPHRNKEIGKSAGSNLNHGGIWYGVSITAVPALYIEDQFLEGNIETGRLRAYVDLASTADCAVELKLCLNVYQKTGGCALIHTCEQYITVTKKTQTAEIELTVPNVRLWSTDDPFLYRVELAAESQFGRHVISKNFGFREFKVKNGHFYLNNKRIYLKCSHTGNIFPIGQMFPAVPELLHRDMMLAKSCGFNTLRSIAGLMRPEQLDVADEIGMLIYEECLASWCMGYSQIIPSESNDELYAEIERRGLMPIGDAELMHERWINATAAMIKRDRNHPCVVIWGLLNETRVSGIFKCAVNFIPKARELDPTRLILLNSGRWDIDFRYGSVSNPYSDKWDNVWLADGTEAYDFRDSTVFSKRSESCGDMHIYGQSPIPRKNIEYFRTMGTPDTPVFFSENGIGSMFHVIEEYNSFVQRGARLDLEDATWLKYQSDAFSRDFTRLGLTSVFPFPEMMLKESQRINADVRREIFDIVRSNPNLAGYSLTGLLDHGMCGEGLWSFWRRPKPEMIDTVCDGFAPVRFCLFIPRCFYSDEEVVVEAVLANDGELRPGNYTADFAIVGEQGTMLTFTENFEVTGEGFASPIFKKSMKLGLPAGKYTLAASLREGVAEGRTLGFFVEERLPVSPRGTVYTDALATGTIAFLEKIGFDCQPFNSQLSGIVIVGETDEEGVKRAANAAEHGARVLFIDASKLQKDERIAALGMDVSLSFPQRSDWLYHSEYVLTHNTVFDGLGTGLVTYPRFGYTFPHNSLITNIDPDYKICPGFATGYHAAKPLSYAMCWAISGFGKGAGKIFFNTFGIEANIGHPTADRLLCNIIEYIKKQ